MTEALVTFLPRPPSLPFLGDILSPSRIQFDDLPLPFLLPGGEGDEISPTVSLLSVNDFTDLVAPKLSREEEVYAISIADAVEESIGVEAANFLRGDDLLSVKTSKLLLASASSGLLGGRMLESSNVQSVLTVVSGLLSTLDGNGGEVEEKLAEATSKLTGNEQNRLDEIVTELTKRVIKRVRARVVSNKTL